MNSVSKLVLSFGFLILSASLLLSSCNGASEFTTADTTSGAPSASVTTTLPASTTTAPITTVEPTPPTTEPKPEDAPMTEEETQEYCMQVFEKELAKIGRSIVISKELTADQLVGVKTFINLEDAKLVISASYRSFYLPEDISLYEMIFSSDIKVEFPNNPFQNDGGLLAVARMRELVQKYLGIDLTQEMLDRLVADGAEYYPEYDAYGFAHYDCGSFHPSQEMYGYLTMDGRFLVHVKTIEDDHVLILLNPTDEGYLIEASQWIRKSKIPTV